MRTEFSIPHPMRVAFGSAAKKCAIAGTKRKSAGGGDATGRGRKTIHDIFQTKKEDQDGNVF